MKKKIINNLLLSTIIALIFTGCYDLDRTPFDQLSSASFWKTEAHCKQGVMGIYAGLKQNDLYGQQFALDVGSDIAVGRGGLYDVLQLGTATSRTGFMNNKWSQGYDVIQRANTAIRNITEADIDPDKKSQFIGEAKFLRAFVYFHLLDYFGGVPLYDETLNYETQFDQMMNTRSTTEATYAFILSDLEDAAKAGLLKKWLDEDYGRITMGTVVALRGKVNLYMKNYKAAISDFEDILANYDYTLYPDFAGLFTPIGGGDSSSEMIFALNNIGDVGNLYGIPLCLQAGSRSTFGSNFQNTLPSVALGDMYEYKDGRPFIWEDVFPGYGVPTVNSNVKERVWRATFSDDGTTLLEAPAEMPQIQQLWADRDPRFMATVIAPYTKYKGWYSNAPKDMDFYIAKKKSGEVIVLNERNGYMRNNQGGWEIYFWRKFVPEYNWNGLITNREHTPVNYPLIRLADVHLMLAEAYNEEGNISKAVENINKVRNRVNMPGINSGPEWLAANTKEEVFERIFRERAFELAGEGHRTSDLRRWRLTHKLLNGVKPGITGKALHTCKFNENRDYLWPIPATEIEINPDLKQNPEW